MKPQLLAPAGSWECLQAAIQSGADSVYFGIKSLNMRANAKNFEETELNKRAYQIALGALKFFMLKMDPAKDMMYNPKESLSFEGETGPYLQYTHARICSILRRYNKKPTIKILSLF